MAITQKEELLHYIKSAIELETDLISQTNVANEYHKEMEKRKPQLIKELLPEDPSMPVAEPIDINVVGAWFIGAFFGVFIGLIMWDTTIPASINILTIVIGILCFFGGIRSIRAPQKKVDKYYREVYIPQKERIDKERKRIEQTNADAEKVYNARKKDWDKVLAENKTQMINYSAETQKTLKKLYAMNEIYPKYRNLPALTSIYEYLVTGRCEELTGPHGAYNMYEDEVRKDTVISQLNTVIENLEKIRQNQYMLYQQVKGIQAYTAVIANELKQIKGYTIALTELTALNTYYTGLNERNTRITMYYHL